MQFRLYSTLRSGRDYSRLWPVNQVELNSLFPENKIIRLTSFGFRYLPLLACLTAFIQYQMLGMEHFPQILAMLLFLVSLPLQGWYWLGIRANTPLPPVMANWYQQISHKMREQGLDVKIVTAPGCYQDLARLLKQAFAQLDKAFVREWL